MEIEQQLRWALMSGEPGKGAEDAVMARVSAAAWRASQVARRRRSRSLIFTAVVLIVAAAAAMLALLPREQRSPEVMAVAHRPVPIQHPVQEVVQAAPVVEVRPRSNVAQPAVAAEPPAKPFTVRVILQDKTTDEESKAGLQLLHANVLERLRNVPGLTVIEPDSTGSAADAPVDFELTVGGEQGSSPRGFSGALWAATRGADGALRTRSGIITTVIPGMVAPACVQPEVAPLSCRDPASVAASMVDSMRKRVFPPDPSLRQALQADLLDHRLNPKLRLQALGTIASLNLKSAVQGAAGSTGVSTQFNPAVIRGAIDLAATASDATVRAQVWRTLRGSRSAELVQPLLVAAREETDGEAKLDAVATLADFSTDARVRNVLEAVVVNESLPLVRAVAQRGLTGDAAWNAYMLDSLQDESRTDAERIEALVYGMFDRGRPDALGNHWDRVSGLLDDKAIHALAQVLPGLQLSAKMTSAMLGQLLANVLSIKHPAITDLLVLGLEGKAGMVVDGRMATWELLGRAQDPRVAAALAASKDPGVRAVLQQASTGDPDPKRREMAASIVNAAAAGVSAP